MNANIDDKTQIALDYAEDAKNSLTLLIEMLKNNISIQEHSNTFKMCCCSWVKCQESWGICK